MAEAGTLHDAFIDELRDTYDAEKQLTKALPKLAKASSNPKLRQAFESHLQETQGQIARLERVFESLDEKVRGKHCEGIAGIIEEGKSIMEEDFDETTMDACLIAAGIHRGLIEVFFHDRLAFLDDAGDALTMLAAYLFVQALEHPLQARDLALRLLKMAFERLTQLRVRRR